MSGTVAVGALDLPFALASLALFFFVPGYLMMKALWPEKRWRGPEGSMVALEMLTGGFVASLGIFLLVGFTLGNAGAFWASPSDPVLEEVLAVLALLLLLLGWWRGAYAHDPPPAPSYAEPAGAGEEEVEEAFRTFAGMVREEKSVEQELRRRKREGAPSGELESLRSELEGLRERRRRAERAREATFDD